MHLQTGMFELALLSRNKAFKKGMGLSKHIWDLKKKKLRLNRSLVYPLQSFRSPCTAILELPPVPRRKKTSHNHNRHATLVTQKIWTNLEMLQTLTNFLPINLLDFFYSLFVSIDLSWLILFVLQFYNSAIVLDTTLSRNFERDCSKSKVHSIKRINVTIKQNCTN